MDLGENYKWKDFHKGKCTSCHSFTGTIVNGDTRCLDCVLEEESEKQLLEIKQNEIRS
jgi:hypothetical protein